MIGTKPLQGNMNRFWICATIDMIPNKKIMAFLKRENNFALIIYITLTILILRSILLTNYRFGFNHDWNFPYTTYELETYVNHALYIWRNTNIGAPIVYPAQYLLQYLLMPFSYLGFTGSTIIKIVLFILFVSSGYFMYLLVRKSFKLAYVPSLVSGIFYATTPVIYNKFVAGHILYLVGYALSPLILTFVIKYINTTRIKYLILAGLLVAFASIQIQFSVMLVSLVVFYSYLVAKVNLSETIKITVLITLIPLLVHSFWILPGVINISSLTETVSTASNIGSLNSWSTSIINAFGLIGYRSHHFSTALDEYNYRSIWSVLSILIIILVYSSLIITKDRVPLFFGIISIISLIFTTALLPPFANIVSFFYSSFSVFNLFREVYHLTFLISFSYSVMLAYTFHKIYNYKKVVSYKFISTLILIIMIAAYNPFIYTGNLNGQVQVYSFDDNDLSLMDKYQESPEDYRVLYLPMIEPFKYNSSKYNGLDPIITYSKKSSMGNGVKSQYIRDMALNLHGDTYGNLGTSLDLLSIKYIFYRNNYKSVLPHYLNNGQYTVYNEVHDIRPIWRNENLYETLVNLEEIKIVDENENIIVFENKNYFPHIYTIPRLKTVDSIEDYHQTLKSNKLQNEQLNIIVLSQNKNKVIPQVDSSTYPNIYFQKLNPTKYNVKIENAKEPFYLIFSETYHPSWQMYITTDTMQCEPITIYDTVNVTECQSESKFFNFNDLNRIIDEPISEENHFVVDTYANAWYIDPHKLDTGENFIATIYYMPQTYFIIGLVISGFTIFLCMAYLLRDERKKLYKLINKRFK
ncbi:hypothetical protein JEZ13_00605 [bacterium]|nr:hypothetical protein [bacterium]